MEYKHCRTLENILSLSALRTVWAANWGDLFPAFHILCLEDDPRKVTTIRCRNNPPCACYHYTILRHDRTGAVAACQCDPPTCPDIDLTIPEITPLRVNRARLGHAIARAMGCQPAHGDLGIVNTRQIGTWSSAAVPVILTIQNEPYQLTSVAARLAAKLRQKFILITPTTHLVTAPCQEHLASVGAALFDMVSTLTLTEHGTLQPLKPPGELFIQFAPDPADSAAETVARQTIALAKALDSEHKFRKAPLYRVFILYCSEGLSPDQIAKECHCTRSIVFSRLKLLAQKLGRHPAELRQYSTHLERIRDSFRTNSGLSAA
jgi:hypothetical protein